MNNRMVAHRWINETHPSGHGSHFYFEGPTIFSYGGHFPIARIVYSGKRKAVLMTTRSRSTSTARHMSITRRSIDTSIPIFEVNDPTLSVEAQISYLELTIQESFEEAKKRRPHKGFEELQECRRYAERAQAFNRFFHLRHRFALPPGFLKLENQLRPAWDAHNTKQAERKARQAEALRRRLEEQAKEVPQLIDDWRNGKLIPYWLWDHVKHPLLRVDGSEIHTSAGARCPIEDAKVIWEAIREVVKRGHPFNGNRRLGLRAGDFKVDSISQDGTLHAGCHHIPYSETLLLAQRLGWAPVDTQ